MKKWGAMHLVTVNVEMTFVVGDLDDLEAQRAGSRKAVRIVESGLNGREPGDVPEPPPFSWDVRVTKIRKLEPGAEIEPLRF